MPRKKPTAKPAPSSSVEPTGFYIRIPEELEPLAKDALDHIERGRELVGLLFEAFGKATTARDAIVRDVRRVRRVVGRRRG